MVKYIIIIEKCENNYFAYCPDLPGCTARGSTVEEVVQRMRVAMELYIEGPRRVRIDIQEPSTEAASVDVMMEGLT